MIWAAIPESRKANGKHLAIYKKGRHMIQKIRLALRNDLEAPEEARYFGSGWFSGVAALVLGIASLCLLLGERL